MNRHFLTTITLLLISIAGYSQFSYNVSLNSGISNIIKHKNSETGYSSEMSIDMFNYTINKSFNFGGDVLYRINNKRFTIGSGIYIGYSSAFTNISNDKYENQRISTNIPIKVYHLFEEWLWIYIGITNQFDVKAHVYDEAVNIETDSYNVGFNAGLDFIIKEKFIFGLNYNRDINKHFVVSSTQLTFPFTDKHYKWHQAYIKLGYIIK